MQLLISHSESVKPYHFHNITYNVFLVNLYIEWEMRKTNEFFSLTFCDIFRDQVEIRRLTEKTESGFQGSVTFTFPCNRWFAKNEDDGAIVRELVPSTVLEEGLGRDGKVSVQEHAIDTLDGELI